MRMETNVEKLKRLAKSASDRDLANAEYRKANRSWLRWSKEIALSIHYYLRTNKMTQKELADKMGVSPTYIGMLLKGNENLTLETISKVESTIGESLISIHKPYRQDMVVFRLPNESKSNWSEAIASSETEVSSISVSYYPVSNICA